MWVVLIRICCVNVLSDICFVFSSKSITSAPCWCWPAPCRGPESTRWTWRWCRLTLCSATRAATRPALPSDSPSMWGHTPSKEEEEEEEEKDEDDEEEEEWRDTERDWERERERERERGETEMQKKKRKNQSCKTKVVNATSHCDVTLWAFFCTSKESLTFLSAHHITRKIIHKMKYTWTLLSRR